jgi:hypothetical protein
MVKDWRKGSLKSYHHLQRFGQHIACFVKQIFRLQTPQVVSTNHLNATTPTKTAAAAAAFTVFTAIIVAKGGAITATTRIFLVTITTTTTHHGSGRLLLVRGGHNFGRQCQVRAQVLNALVGQVAIIVLPRKGCLDVATGRERFHQV